MTDEARKIIHTDGKKMEKNPRKITRNQKENLKRDLYDHGDLSGVVHDLNSNQFIGGNQRSDVFDINSCEIEIIEEFPQPDRQGTVAHGFIIWQDARYAYRQVRWTPEQCREANIKANLVGGSWDTKIMEEWGDDLKMEWGFDAELHRDWKSSDDWLAAKIESEKPAPVDAEPDIDRAEGLREKLGVELGQMWQMGDHRLICGDCTDAAVVARVMGGEKADFCFTDPPYNVGVIYKQETNDNQSFDDFVSWCKSWATYLPQSFILTVGVKRLLWWHAILGDPLWIISWIKKNGQSNTGLGGTNKWDPILVYGCKPDNNIDIVEVNNDYSEKIVSSGDHPTPKPVELWSKMIDRFSQTGAIIYEPFDGTGTTIIACENLGRKCRAVEISPQYVAVALERFFVATGKKPALIE